MTYFPRTLRHSTTYFLKGRKLDYAPNTSKSLVLATCQICQYIYIWSLEHQFKQGKSR